MKKVLLALFFVALYATSYAQSGSLSPYAMYGIGALCSQANGPERQMNGVGVAFREGNQVNFLNPASYSSMDSLTFLFDIGMSMDHTQYKEGSGYYNANVANFEYAMMGFRVIKHLGMALGVVPVSTINYTFDSTEPLYTFDPLPYSHRMSQVSATTTYYGDGGLRQLFLGAGYEPIKGLSVGANFMLLWGSITKGLTLEYTDSDIKELLKIWNQDITSFRFNVGLQYTFNINKKNAITAGITYTPGMGLGGDATKTAINYSSAAADTTTFIAAGGYQLPHDVSLGVALKRYNWKIGLDYTFQNWSALPATNYVEKNTGAIEGHIVQYSDLHKINVGGEWCRNPMGRKFFDRIRFRAGFSYTTPYLNINAYDINNNAKVGYKGPREFSLSFGAGIPIINAINNRSIFNIGFQWVNESGSLIRENTFRLNLGLTFNERWFAKWKFE